MAKPIIVVARNRSGSKWLSNIIATHSRVACIQCAAAGGILETNMFFYFPRLFGDLSWTVNYLSFAVCYAETDFYKLSGLERELLFRKEHHSKDYFELFRWHMDEVTVRRRKDFWVQKAHVAEIPILLQKFPDARFFVIERDVVPNIRSTVARPPRRGESIGSLTREVVAWVLAHKRARRFQGRSNVKFIRYEDLQDDREATVRAVCEHIGLAFEPQMLEDTFAPNTSFSNELQRNQVLTPLQERWILWLTPLVKLVPRGILDALAVWSRRREPRRKLHGRTYRSLEIENGWAKPEAAEGRFSLPRSAPPEDQPGARS